MAVEKRDGCNWCGRYQKSEWKASWLTLERHAAEQVEAARRHELPVPGRKGIYAPPELHGGLEKAALLEQTKREVRARSSEDLKSGRSLDETMCKVFDGVLLRRYLEAVPEEDFDRLYRRLFAKACHLLRSRFEGIDLQEEAGELVQDALADAFEGRRPWPRRGSELLPLYPFLARVMESIVSNRNERASRAARRGAAPARYDSEDDLGWMVWQHSATFRADAAPRKTPVRDRVDVLLGELSPDRRAVIERLVAGWKVREIQEDLGGSLSTIYRWVDDFRGDLLEALSARPNVDEKEL